MHETKTTGIETRKLRTLHALGMVSLTPLLLALWSGQAGAVTLEGAQAARVAVHVSAAMEAAIPQPDVRRLLATLDTSTPDGPVVEDTTAKMASLGRDVSIATPSLALARAAAQERTSSAARADDHGPAFSSTRSLAEPTAIDLSLGMRQAVTIVKPRTSVASASTPTAGPRSVSWWWGLVPLVPGVVVGISIRELRRNRKVYYRAGW